MTYKISIAALTTDGGVSIEGTQYESEEEFLPKLGLIKQGAMITPYYVLDGKKYFFKIDGASSSRSLDLSQIFTNTEEFDFGIFIAARELDLVDVFIDSFTITGDAEFVR